MQGFKITDPIDNIVTTDKFNYFLTRDEIVREYEVCRRSLPPIPDCPPFTRHRGDRPSFPKINKPKHVCLLLHGIRYSESNEALYYALNNSNFKIGLTDSGYYKVMIPDGERWVFVNSPFDSTDYGRFKAEYLESRWEF